jgi:hypothetical protein
MSYCPLGNTAFRAVARKDFLCVASPSGLRCFPCSGAERFPLCRFALRAALLSVQWRGKIKNAGRSLGSKDGDYRLGGN